jgi:integrase
MDDFNTAPQNQPDEGLAPAPLGTLGKKGKKRREKERTREAAIAARKFAGNPKKQIEFTLGKSLPAAIGRERPVSIKRISDMYDVMCRIINDLKKINVRVQDVRNISRKNAVALVRYWSERPERPLSKATIDQYVNVLRCYMTMIGKPGVVPEGEEWRACLEKEGLAIARERRGQIALEAKGWTDKNVDLDDLLPAIREKSPVCAAILRLIEAFGARPSEGWQYKPERGERKDHIYLTETKGGKPRPVYYYDDQPELRARQLEAFEEALAVAKKVDPDRGLLAEPGLSPKQMRRRFYYVMELFGITKKGLGVVPHGLRHDYANKKFEHLSGLPAPAKQLLPAAAYRKNKDVVDAARKAVSADLGHERKSITGAYNGNVRSLKLAEARSNHRMAKLLERMEVHAPLMLLAGMHEAWVLDVEALASSLKATPTIAIGFTRESAHGTGPHSAKALVDVAQRLSLAVGCAVSFMSWEGTERPENSLEINLEQARRNASGRGPDADPPGLGGHSPQG